ncbi:MAG: methyltransferase [Bacteriovoracaceae bacterium]
MQTDYLQPDFYRFSDDSLKLVNFVLDDFNHTKDILALDLCAGSGVVGIELAIAYAQKKNKISKLDFCEVQDAFLPYLEKNCAFFLNDFPRTIYHQNYQDLKLDTKYDLIVSNPPYFFQGRGLLSPQLEKNRCRFFLDSNLKEFFLCLVRHLKVGGTAYFLSRPDEQELSVAQSALPLEFVFLHKKDFGSCALYAIENRSLL